MQMPIIFVDGNPNIGSREKGLALSAVRSHTTKLVLQKRRKKWAPRFEKLTPTTTMAGQVQESHGATPTTTAMLDRVPYDPSQPAQQQLGDQHIGQAIENGFSDTCPMVYAVSEPTDVHDVKYPMDWLDSHHFDPFDTLPSKVTQDFVTTWNLYCKCTVGFWFPCNEKGCMY